MAGRGHWYVTSLLAVAGILCRHTWHVSFVGVQRPVRARAAPLPANGVVEDVVDAVANHAGTLMEMLRLPKLLKLIEQDNTGELLKQTTFPRIVVMGDENAGKSSTLERIAGVDVLPRSDGITTRQPTVLKLRHDPTINDEEPQLTLRIPSQEELSGLTAKQIREHISMHMSNIAQQQHGVEIGQEIEVEVRSSGVPSVDLVDLPGLIAVQVASDTEPEGLSELTEQCTRKYLDHETTGAVMCVLDATINNMRTSRALRLVQDSRDCLKRYTIGVLAKADKSFDPNWEDEGHNSAYWKLEARKSGTSTDYVPLDFGYVPVKNRNTNNRVANHCIREHNLQEEQWFAKHMPGVFDVGISSVIQRLDRLFHEFLGESYVPKKREELNARKEACMEKLELLGTDPVDLCMPDVVSHFNQVLSTTLQQGEADAIFNAICERLRADLPVSDNSDDSRLACVAATMTLREHFFSAIQDEQLVDVAEAHMKMIVRQVFDSDSSGHIRLCRFGRFLDGAEDFVADCITSQSEKFSKDAVSTVLFLCSTSRGEPLDVDRMCKAMADCVIEHFVLPVAHSNGAFYKSEMSQGQQYLTEDCAEERAAYLEELAQIDKGLTALDRIKEL